MEKPKIYTIGHSSHSIEYFYDMLDEYGVNCVVDVRSFAASTYNPQYNKEALSSFLKSKKINYLHFAKEFGARHTSPSLLDEDGKIDFEKVRKTASFKEGKDRLWKGVASGFTIALMCSEADPLDCHRFSMISVALDQDGFYVNHILKDKTLASNKDLESQLLKKYHKKLPVPNIFEPNITIDDQINAAYRLKNMDIAFMPSSPENIEHL